MRPVRLSRPQQQAITRERLLAAAESVFSRLGYGGTSVDLIAAEAGYSKGAVYSNFPNKEAIFLELLQLYMERGNAELERLLKVKPENLPGAVTEWLKTMHAEGDCPLLVMELQLHARRSPDFAKRYYELQGQQAKTLARIVRTFFDITGATMPIHALDLANSLTALAHGLSLQRPVAKSGVPSDPGRIIDSLFKVLMKKQ
jgi:AcrR family transcriptional regulator